MLEVQNLTFSYGKNKVLDNVNFKLDYGKLVCLLGENGAGKSTLFKCILQLYDNYAGVVAVNSKNLKKMKHTKIAKYLSYIPQEHKGVFNYTVEQVVLMSTTNESMFKRPGKKEIKRMEDALEKINIKHLRYRGYMELSGGERQLVLVARALAQDAKILIMDEPTSNLDFKNQTYLMSLLKKLAKDGYTIFISIHNPDFALRYGDEVVVLSQRKIRAKGIPDEVMTNKLLSEIYQSDITVSKIENSDKKTCVARVEL
ncbi:MAG: ABC transporter ATP-binding protein [Eubacteriales bacterium]|nr:ABC transporter ATP-binding protein [Eubacteriales bacterium]MDY3333185.1 ABC transporter ATP-binding protein [Gallibacter sp.]